MVKYTRQLTSLPCVLDSLGAVNSVLFATQLQPNYKLLVVATQIHFEQQTVMGGGGVYFNVPDPLSSG